MRLNPLTVRIAGLVTTGSLIVHELRYAIAGGGTEGPAHAYLPLAGLVSALLLGLAAGQFAERLEEARRTGRHDRARLSFPAAWALLALCIAAVFTAQELIETTLAGGPAGVEGVLGSGGWIALLLSAALAAPFALAVSGAHSVVAAAARALRLSLPRRMRSARRPRPAPHAVFAGVLACHLAGRAPPAVC